MEELGRESLDVVSWVNRCLHGKSADQLLAEVREDWSQAQADLSSALAEALRAVPTSVREAERVRQKGANLMEGVERVSKRVEGVESGAEEAVAAIAEADAVLRRVEDTRNMLSRVAEVDALVDRIDAIFVGGDLLAVANALSKIREDLDTLEGIPELQEKRKALLEADEKLNSIAEPRLGTALEAKSVSGTQAALEIFTKSGRVDAFISLYVSFRGGQLRAAWGEMFQADSEQAIARFYESMVGTLDSESTWLLEAVPDLRPKLLPALVLDVFSQLVPPLNLDLPREVDSGADHAHLVDATFYSNAVRAAALARRLVGVCFEDDSNWPDVELLADSCDLVTAPTLAYFNCFAAVQRVIVSSAGGGGSSAGQPLSAERAVDLVREKIEPLRRAGEEAVRHCITRTRGIMLGASFDAHRAAAAALAKEAERLVGAAPAAKSQDWMTVQAALSLLTMVASLARSWAEMKNSFASEAVIAAMPLVEVASAVHAEPATLLTEFTGAPRDEEAMILWALARSQDLRERVVTALQTCESPLDDQSGGDFRSLLVFCKNFLYNSLFQSIRTSISALPRAQNWTADTRPDASKDVDMPEFSITPSTYATEVGEYLLTIPRQLEPYIPDKHDAVLAAPNSAAATADGDVPDDVEVNFASRWIAAIADGTMDLYAQKILDLGRLSAHGASQLAVDLEYICSVLGALGVGMSPSISGIRAVLEADNILEAVHAIESPAVKRAAARAAAMRGVRVVI